MKKLLLATTMLVGTAGLASAEVTLSGDARMGIVHDATDATTFTSRARVSFGLSAESDSGLAFGASFGAHNAAAAASGTAGSVYVSGAFGKLSMGDVDSAFGAAFGQIGGVGLTGLGDLNEVSHSADGGKFSTGGWTDVSDTVYVYEYTFIEPGDGRVYDETHSEYSPLYNSLFSFDAEADEWVSSTAAFGTLADSLEFQFGDKFSAAEFRDDVSSSDDEEDLYDYLIDEDGYPETFWYYPADEFMEGIAAGFGVDADYDELEYLAEELLGEDYPFEYVYSIGIETDWNIDPIDAKALYSYSSDAFSVALGHSQLGNAQASSVAASFTTGGLKVALGYENANWKDALTSSLVAYGQVYEETEDGYGYELADDEQYNIGSRTLVSHSLDASAKGTNLGVSYTMDALTVAAIYQDKHFTLGGREMDEIVTTGLSATYAADAVSVTGFTRSADSSATGRNTVYGLGVGYDIGGGAAVKGGVVGGDTHTVYDLGLSFSF